MELDYSPSVGPSSEPDLGPPIRAGYGTNKTGSELKPNLELEPLFRNGPRSGSSMWFQPGTVPFATLLGCLVFL